MLQSAGSDKITDVAGMKVMIGIPCGNSISPYTFTSILQTISYMNAKGCSLGVYAQVGLYVCNNRNLLIKKFLSTECSHILFVDSDMQFEPTDLENLIRREVSIVSALYGNRHLPTFNAFDKMTNDLWTTIDPRCVKKPGLHKILASGGGFLLCTRESLVKMAKDFESGYPHAKDISDEYANMKMRNPWFETSQLSDGTFIGEDLLFGYKATKMCGIDYYVDTAVKVKHISTLAVFPCEGEGFNTMGVSTP